jgi:hypothetical protein
VRETFVAVVIDNIPMIYPLCLRIFRTVDDTLASHYASKLGPKKLSAGGYYSSSVNNNSGGSYAMGDRKEKKSKSKFVHPLSLRNATMSDSSESIVRAERVKDGRDILIVKESSIVVRPTTTSDEDLSHYPGQDRVPRHAYETTCGHSRRGSLGNNGGGGTVGRESTQWR